MGESLNLFVEILVFVCVFISSNTIILLTGIYIRI